MRATKALRPWIWIGAPLVLVACEASPPTNAFDETARPPVAELAEKAQERGPALGRLQRNKNTEIPNGTEADPAEFPFAVSLGPDAVTRLCGGTVVSPGWVLTAGHCRNDRVVQGRRFQSPGSGKVLGVAVKHYCPTTFREATFKHDIALLQVSGAGFPELSRVDLVADDSWYVEGRLVTLIGWGKTTNGVFPFKLMEGEVKIYSRSLCEQEYGNPPRFAFDGETLCTERGVNLVSGASGVTGTPSVDSGDSGGPVLIGAPGAYFQAGVISVGEGNTLPDRHIKLTEPLRKWIRAVINDTDHGATRAASQCTQP